eukprot:gene3802-4065_t
MNLNFAYHDSTCCVQRNVVIKLQRCEVIQVDATVSLSQSSFTTPVHPSFTNNLDDLGRTSAFITTSTQHIVQAIRVVARLRITQRRLTSPSSQLNV